MISGCATHSMNLLVRAPCCLEMLGNHDLIRAHRGEFFFSSSRCGGHGFTLSSWPAQLTFLSIFKLYHRQPKLFDVHLVAYIKTQH